MWHVLYGPLAFLNLYLYNSYNYKKKIKLCNFLPCYIIASDRVVAWYFAGNVYDCRLKEHVP